MYLQALAAAPEDVDTLRCLAGLRQQQGRFDEALRCFDRVVSLRPSDAAAWNEHGGVLAAAGRIDRALASFQRATELDPSLAEPACNLGQALCLLRRHHEALPWLERAIARQPRLLPAHMLIVEALQALGRHADAVDACARALRLDPANPQLDHLLGTSLLVLRRHAEALAAFDRALTRQPQHLDALNSRGNCLAALGRQEEALETFARALALKADFPEALHNQGLVLASQKRHIEATQCFERALAYRPDFAEAHASMGASLEALARRAEALESLERALAIRPELVAALINRGITLLRLGRYAQALASLDRALARRPGDTRALNARGNALAALGRMEEAWSSFGSALAGQPDYLEALVSYGLWLVRAGRHGDAQPLLQRALAIEPNYPEVAGTLFYATAALCEWQQYESLSGEILDRVSAGAAVAAPFHMLLLVDSPEDQLACARLWVRDRYSVPRAEAPRLESAERKRLKVAYLSPDFRNHPVARQVCGLIERHDRTQFETIAVAFGRPAPADPLRARLALAFDHFIEVPDSVSDDDVARQIRELDVAIAVDLAGFTTDARPGVLARQVAPIQVNFLGYPGTSGADYMQYIIADRVVIPPTHRSFYTEQVVEMPDSFFVAGDARDVPAPPSRGECGLPEEAFVYCCFNNHGKITPGVFDTWMRILRNVPNSVLWLPEPKLATAANLRREAHHRGVAPERLLFAPRVPATSAYLARLQLADLFLDTLPYNAHSTACDALRSGLPVLTCLGQTFAGRVAASLLQAVGTPELIVESPQAYEALACTLAEDRTRLAELRARLRSSRDHRGFFDPGRFTRQLERAYRAMWERHARAEPPSPLLVPASL